jgi:hypothetical protein
MGKNGVCRKVNWVMVASHSFLLEQTQPYQPDAVAAWLTS